MTSGSMSAKCAGGGLALADFGRDPRITNSLRKIVFSFKNSQKLLTKFLGLATSGQLRHDYRSPEIYFQLVSLRDV